MAELLRRMALSCRNPTHLPVLLITGNRHPEAVYFARIRSAFEPGSVAWTTRDGTPSKSTILMSKHVRQRKLPAMKPQSLNIARLVECIIAIFRVAILANTRTARCAKLKHQNFRGVDLIFIRFPVNMSKTIHNVKFSRVSSRYTARCNSR